MVKNCLHIIVISLLLLVQSSCVLFFIEDSSKTDTLKSDTVEEKRGLEIMTKVSKRDRGEDYIISTSWKLAKDGKVRHSMNYVEMRKNYGGKDGFNYKSVIRYTHPPSVHRRAILVWNYRDKEKAFWYFLLNFRDAKRAINTEFLRPPAEADFSLIDYIDINLEEEAHRLLESEEHEGIICYMVESIPVKNDIKYGKRVSWIDQHNWIPLKTDYFDKKGALWKTLRIKWQNISGVWFWKEAVVENAQKDYKTFITIEEVKVNVGLNDREFTKVALEKITF